MTPLHDWLARALADGESVQDAPPVADPAGRADAVAVLRAAFDRAALDVAGPPVGFDPGAAYGAAVALARACWHVAGPGGGEPVSEYLAGEPATPAAHLSADVCLRLLPAVYLRAKVRVPELARELDALLRRWPLSGVLADLDGAPATAPEFDHPGLRQLYAERLAATGRPGWVPRGGGSREWVERIFHERGRPVPGPPQERTGD